HDYSTRIRQIKTLFTRAHVQTRQPIHKDSQLARQEHPIWQRRFFEHKVRSGTDLTRCADYIHVNPLKHRLVERVVDWPWSSFHRFLKQGHYGADWGSAQHWYGDEFTHFE
ncbi:MAG: transposase, partial [Planctomycetota bacterium]